MNNIHVFSRTDYSIVIINGCVTCACWGEPERAPHRRSGAAPLYCMYICMYVKTVGVQSGRCPDRVRTSALRTRFDLRVHVIFHVLRARVDLFSPAQ